MDNQQAYQEMLDLLFGGAISKSGPDGPDLHVPGGDAKKDRRKRKITAGLSAVGATAGAAGLGLAAHDLKEGYKAERKVKPITGRVLSRGQAARATVKNRKLASALLPLEVAGLGGEVMATKILHSDTKKKPVAKKFTPYDVKWEGEFSKVNHDKQQVFGWASIVELNGEPVVDLQGDYIAIEEVEKAGYEYVIKSRKGGDMHLRDGEQPVHASDMIESFIVTPEKKKALGLPDEMPIGWWVGYQVNDPEVWAKVKDGRRTGFSIHGRGVRKDA